MVIFATTEKWLKKIFCIFTHINIKIERHTKKSDKTSKKNKWLQLHGERVEEIGLTYFTKKKYLMWSNRNFQNNAIFIYGKHFLKNISH